MAEARCDSPAPQRILSISRSIVPLHPPAWSLDAAELAEAFGPRTKLVVLNTPHNPTGKVACHGVA